MSDSTDPKLDPGVCPDCGAPLAAAMGGLCSRCLMAEAAQPTNGPSAGAAGEQPALAEVAAAFPQFEVFEQIGAGGMGTVWRARQPKLDRQVALKLLPASLAERDPAFAERFEREGQLLARLHHPNIVVVHDSGRAGSFFYLVMEFVDGVNLRQAMRASRFTPQQALAIVPKICDALQYAHEEGVLHRDIKPENILLDAKGRVKLVDFGIAKLVAQAEGDSGGGGAAAPAQAGSRSLTQGDATLGTPNYMAPEQMAQPAGVDHRADIYSLGVVFYELLTGELPTGIFAPPSAKSGADPRLDDIVRQALERERGRRQQSAEEFRTQVETVADSSGGEPAPPVGPADVTGDSGEEPRFSRKAIVGACWAPWFSVAFVAMFWVAEVQEPTPTGPEWWRLALMLTLLPLGFFAPFGTTILGWVAVGQIRRSAGKLCGLGLAVTDGLLFPMLALCVLIMVFWWWTFSELAFFRYQIYDPDPRSAFAFAWLGYQHWGGLAMVASALTCGPLCFFITRRVWIAVTPQDDRLAALADLRAAERVVLGIAAMVCAVLSIMPTIAILSGPPVPPQDNVGSGLLAPSRAVVAALLFLLLSCLLAVPVRQTRLGKGVLAAGAVHFLAWLLIAFA